MFPELKGKVLFVFSDPGGAKPVLALAEQCKDAVVVSDREHPFYSDFNVQVTIAKNNYEKIIADTKPDLIFSGTSYRSDIEREFRALAKQHAIPCYAFVDHWTSMRKRFEQTDGTLLVPEQVWVIDERAKQLAVEGGIAQEQIAIVGNPYHTWLRQWKPVQSKQVWMQAAGIPENAGQLLVFAPDPLSNVNGINLYGFDELTVVAELTNLFDSNGEWTLLIKSHPNQNLEKLTNVLGNAKHTLLLPGHIDTNTTLYHADAVMGFFSNILIEADILHKPVLRYLPNTEIDDPIRELNIGKITNRAELMQHLHAYGILK